VGVSNIKVSAYSCVTEIVNVELLVFSSLADEVADLSARMVEVWRLALQEVDVDGGAFDSGGGAVGTSSEGGYGGAQIVLNLEPVPLSLIIGTD